VRIVDDADLVSGVLAELATPRGQADPYPIYQRLRRRGEVGRAPDGTLVVVGHRLCAALLKDHRLAKHPERLLTLAGHQDWDRRPSLHTMFTSLLMINPPQHTRLRRLVSRAFTARRVAELRPALARLAEDLCDELADQLTGPDAGEGADFVEGFAFPFPVTVIGELLGVPAEDRARFQGLVRDWTMVLELLSPLAVERADDAAIAIRDYLGHLAEQRRAEPRDDLVSALVTAGPPGGEAPMDDDELVTMLALLFAAGFETTTGLLSNGLVALLEHPRQAAALAADDALAGPATEELLRFDSPVQMLFGRSADVPLQISGLELGPQQRIVLLLGAGNRDPDVYAEPDDLWLARGGEAPLSFGGGIHYCLGAPLARLEAQIALPMLFRRFPRLRVAGEPARRTGLALHGWTSLPITA
jgi:cytochrome P450